MSPDPWMVKQLSNPNAERWLEATGHLLGYCVPPGMGFALLLFDFGAGGGMYYTSNAQRADVLTAMQEFVEKNQPPKEDRHD